MIVDAGKTGIDSDSFLELFYSLRKKASLAVSPTNKDPQWCSIAQLNDHTVVDLFSFRELMLSEVCESQRVCNVIICGRQFLGCSQFMFGFLKLTNHEIGFSHH